MSASEAADYIRTHLVELEELARVSGLDILGYLLGVARLEAETHITDRRLGAARHNGPLWANHRGLSASACHPAPPEVASPAGPAGGSAAGR